MTNQRKFSRERHKIKLNEREAIEKRLKAILSSALKEDAPTTPLYAIDVISEVSATIASQLLAQTQATHRTLSTMKDDAIDYATEFVVQFVGEARKDINARFKKRTVLPPASEGVFPLADDWAGPVAGPTDLERHFGIPRSTLYRWQKRKEIIYLKTRSVKRPVFPLKQFRDGRPTKGIAELVGLFADESTAWRWLVDTPPNSDAMPYIDVLLSGEIDAVLTEARTHLASVAVDQ